MSDDVREDELSGLASRMSPHWTGPDEWVCCWNKTGRRRVYMPGLASSCRECGRRRPPRSAYLPDPTPVEQFIRLLRSVAGRPANPCAGRFTDDFH